MDSAAPEMNELIYVFSNSWKNRFGECDDLGELCESVKGRQVGFDDV